MRVDRGLSRAVGVDGSVVVDGFESRSVGGEGHECGLGSGRGGARCGHVGWDITRFRVCRWRCVHVRVRVC